MASSSGGPTVWIMLKGEKQPMKVTMSAAADVADLKESIKAKYSNQLVGVDPGKLMIYKTKDAFDNRNDANPEHEASC